MSVMADKMSRIRLLLPLTVIAIVGVCIAAVALYVLRPSLAPSTNSGAAAAMAQRIALNAASAMHGDQAAFDALARERERFSAWQTADGAQIADRSGAQKLATSSQQVLAAQGATLAMHAAARAANSAVPQLLQGLGNIVSAFGAQRVESISPHLERFEAAGQRVTRELQTLADGVGDAKQSVRRINDSLEFMGQVLGELRGEEASIGLPRVTGADNEQKLKVLTAQYRKLADDTRAALGAADQIAAAHQASRETLTAQQILLPSLQPQAGSDARAALPLVPLVILGVVLLILVMLLVVSRTASGVGREARKQGDQNERNQQAILRLLDELSNLADGDLTVQATVTEDITGAIADSINYAIEALRELVTTINGTAITLDAAAKQTLASAGHLAKASVAQSKQVASASESAAAMASSVEEVSGNAERSADVSRHAVDIAHKGGDAVRRTIDGMNTIRETIQETSKRIKRLGESSQEIGNIVELINDIAEQTNILALNASIQASMAGDAGRGFAVVADEVQRLAERAANATKQIEVLVRTIQADTNEAVVSMERSTTDVVGGALLAENAGAALQEIEQVSNQIASLVQNISASSRQQTTAAQDIARNMQVLREISAQTAENSAATTNSIGKLA
ncbi:MAG: methyl-accepting chemotaxis protein, partial [Candidatus Obscuribacterales bacterium]|nr:methyl-accepting chemotaxis protein [Steroidobacteraceae bacterium]